jgi:alpha-1,2-mannosyltransferase
MTALQRLRALRYERPRLAALAGFTALFFLCYPLVDAWMRGQGIAPPFRYWDWGAYGGAVNRWQSGEAIYVRNESGGFHGGYLYPPFVLLLFLPFTWFPYPMGPALWGAVSVLLLWRGLVGVVRTAGYDPTTTEEVLLLFAVVGFQPLLLSVKMGQMAGFVVGGLCLAYAVLPREGSVDDAAGDADAASTMDTVRSVVSGMVTGGLGLAKLPYAPASAHLLTDRRRLLGGVVGAVGLVGLSLAVFGIDTNVAYLDVWRWGIDAGGRVRHPTLWMAPYYRPFYPIARQSFVVQVALSLAIALLAVRAPKSANPEVFALGLAAVPLVAPKTYTYYLVALLPAAAVLLVREARRDGRLEIPLLALVLANLHSYGLRALGEVGPALGGLESAWNELLPLLQPGLWANCLLVGLAAWRVGKATTWTNPVTDHESTVEQSD